jgi:hypothetical protein
MLAHAHFPYDVTELGEIREPGVEDFNQPRVSYLVVQRVEVHA